VIAYCCIFNGKPNPEKMSCIAEIRKCAFTSLLVTYFPSAFHENSFVALMWKAIYKLPIS